MSESNAHKKYVKMICEYIKLIIPEDNLCFLRADIDKYERPKLIYTDFIPDVIYLHDGMLIIGEAKTEDDFSSIHSNNQFKAYFEEFRSIKSCDSILIICVPWDKFVSASNKFKSMKNEYDIKCKIIVLTDGGMKAEL